MNMTRFEGVYFSSSVKCWFAFLAARSYSREDIETLLEPEVGEKRVELQQALDELPPDRLVLQVVSS